ncbi:hypothetical protein FIU91_18515 [Roseivivax sp. THAF30]|nr:hypothetical protein FIU91_18515 [Roseivivax sp. THAF30]
MKFDEGNESVWGYLAYPPNIHVIKLMVQNIGEVEKVGKKKNIFNDNIGLKEIYVWNIVDKAVH